VTSIVLRDYQVKLKNDIYNSWRAGNRNVLAVSVTGSGKSVIMSDIITDGFRSGLRQVVMAHRNELVTQMSSHIARRGIQHRIIGPNSTIAQARTKHREEFGVSFVNPNAPTAVIGVDTLMARKDNLKAWAQQVDRWVIDEAHHVIGNDRVDPNKWGKAVKMFSNAYGLGVTATPLRADGQGLGRLFDGCMDDLVLGPPMRQLIEQNYLSDYEIVCPISDLKVDLKNVSKDGDWSSKTLRKAAKQSRIVGDVVENYCKYAIGRRALVFATDIETADDIADKFNNFGIRAASLNGKSLSTYRDHCLKGFERGEFSILINVDLFDEGFDCPACDVVILARPTASLGKYLQMIGRALRYLPGKTALVIDHVSNVIRHGLPDKEREWSLGRRDKKAKHKKDPDEIPLTRCPNCKKPYEKFRTICPYCNTEKPLPDPSSRSIEMVEGDLVLLNKKTLAQMRQSTILENPDDINKRVTAVAGPIAGKGVANRQLEKIKAQKELIDVINQWAGIERARGFTDREIHKRFYLTLGVDVLTALNNSKTKKEFENTTQTIRSWYEGKYSNFTYMS